MAAQPSRFQAELEFIQRLANPEYLHCAYEHAARHDLAQTRLLDDEDFLRYLEYLKYWQRPEYCQHVAFPHCLRFLELLREPAFRQALKRPDFKDFVATQQHAQWRYRLPVLDAARAELRAQLTD